jgi:hypothetical protein
MQQRTVSGSLTRELLGFKADALKQQAGGHLALIPVEVFSARAVTYNSK